ncbi:CtrA inhibitor SciP [Desertibaculum subflavum]|uniref:CtrA inhibitor SciP n=1 Tax=Desertibaculum subflavum TaxID=2268458 RepID=UPI003F66A8F7
MNAKDAREMLELERAGAGVVIGPEGKPLTIADLPPPDTKRWVIRRKAEVVAAVRGGLLSLEDACRRYSLTVEEFLSWQRAIDAHGLPGLRATRIQYYRPTPAERSRSTG